MAVAPAATARATGGGADAAISPCGARSADGVPRDEQGKLCSEACRIPEKHAEEAAGGDETAGSEEEEPWPKGDFLEHGLAATAVIGHEGLEESVLLVSRQTQVEVIRKKRRRKKNRIPLLSRGRWFGIPPPARKQNANQPALGMVHTQCLGEEVFAGLSRWRGCLQHDKNVFNFPSLCGILSLLSPGCYLFAAVSKTLVVV